MERHTASQSLSVEFSHLGEGPLIRRESFHFSTLNSRSGYRLRHVCLGAQVPDDEGLRKLSEELGKSSDSLRVLGLVSEFPGDVIMKQAKMVCPKLNTLQIMGPREYHPRAMSILFSFRQRMGIRDLEDEKLKYLRCGNLSLVGEEYKDYLSTMESLCIRGTSSLTALRSILMASQSTLNELDLLAWAAISSPFSTTGKGKLRLKSLRNLRLPFLPAALNDLDDVMEVEGKLNRLGSSLSTLVKFDSRAVKHLELYLFAEEVPFQVVLLRNLEEETAIQMQQHHSIGELTLWCPNSKTGGKKHLDFLLKTLLSSRSEVEIDFESLVLNEED